MLRLSWAKLSEKDKADVKRQMPQPCFTLSGIPWAEEILFSLFKSRVVGEYDDQVLLPTFLNVVMDAPLATPIKKKRNARLQETSPSTAIIGELETHAKSAPAIPVSVVQPEVAATLVSNVGAVGASQPAIPEVPSDLARLIAEVTRNVWTIGRPNSQQ
eukprot:TRINITY_DN1631_c0_g1_i2.p1 TRINITY_DN1631_c0_g1~~TRINITY_DN1631_c0_g1_i2.p1  ORF type:complete len:159 (+),score=26.38 TRINITY_DN1631_c0_g1_i2:784-1260(+)